MQFLAHPRPACRDAPALKVEIEGCGHRPCRGLNWHKNRTQNLLLLPFAASFLCNIRHTSQIWRKRVGVEPTIRPAKDRIAGFEGRGSHRTPFASGGSIAGEEKRFRQRKRTSGPMIRRESAAKTDGFAFFRGWHCGGIDALAEACALPAQAGVASTAVRCVRTRAATRS
jgi:hypothetical protein